MQDFILSILQASPSVRDSRSYLSSFAPPPATAATVAKPETPTETSKSNAILSSILNPTLRRPALVKIQGPFTDPQLNSVAKGMARLQKLGLVPVIVVDRDDIPQGEPYDRDAAQRQRQLVMRDVERVVYYLGRHRAAARPVLATVARMGDDGVYVEEEGLDHIRRAVEEGEIPVLLPVALDEGCRSRRVNSNYVLTALAEAMVRPATPNQSQAPPPSANDTSSSVSRRPTDLTPMRLLVINREGGIPSYARSGLPHLSINLEAEYDHITSTFLPSWRSTHPTALANLSLADQCLRLMPKEASALIVSHRSPAALIANLITNKPAHSASLPHALLESGGRLTRDTPTLIRKGLPVRVIRDLAQVDRAKLTNLLETSFRRTLNADKFWPRMARDMDFCIVVGDYAGAAIVTNEPGDGQRGDKICYLDKFAVHPSHQGDGTVDFLWVSLRDETYGLGLPDSANPSVGSLRAQPASDPSTSTTAVKHAQLRGRDLVWRSRSDNPVNRWYFERSSGFTTSKDGRWKVFWCDAEERVDPALRALLASRADEQSSDPAEESAEHRHAQDERDFGGGRLVRIIEDDERGRVGRWEPVVGAIESVWV